MHNLYVGKVTQKLILRLQLKKMFKVNNRTIGEKSGHREPAGRGGPGGLVPIGFAKFILQTAEPYSSGHAVPWPLFRYIFFCR
jgi:hypothetical protein